MADREELRKLAEAATPGPWVSGDPSFGNGNAHMIVSISDRAMGRDIQGPNLRPALFDVEFIAAANPAAVLGLLDQLDAAEAKLAAVREIHSPARWYDEFCDDPSCEQEHVEIDVGDLYHAHPSWLVCECCSGGDLSETDEPAPWPCPTTRALDEGTDHE